MQLGLPNVGAGPMRVSSVGGIMPVMSLSQVLERERRDARERAEAQNSQPVVQELASFLRKRWTQARDARREIEQDMLRALRASRGQYDPEKLRQLRSQGSSEIYMMLFATKARQAKALIGDVLLGTADDKPWSLRPSPKPSLPEDVVAQIMQGTAQMVMQAEMSGLPMSVEDIRQLLRDAKTEAEAQIAVEARDRCARAETKLEDMLAEGGFIEALDAFLEDLTVFKTAFIKGPVIRKRGVLRWVQGPQGYVPEVVEDLLPNWERVDPLMIYPEPWSKGVQHGGLFERHRLTEQALSELIGVEGYSDDAIREVLVSHGTGGLTGWLDIDTERAEAEGRDVSSVMSSDDLIDALQYWGHVSGKLLREWGMTPEEVPDEAKVYAVEAWLVGNWVIKAAINADPLARKPYYATSYRKVPGSFWGLSMYDTMADCQDLCNAAARSLVNNLAIASGPQVWVNNDRIPAGEEITEMYPWKIWQFSPDMMGSNAQPIGFFQPTSNAQELMAVYEKFSMLADEYTGIPRYMTGDGSAGGAGRTASGMSMMIGNAGKTIKSWVQNIDINTIGPLVERGFEWMMRYRPDPDFQGDLQVVARGALSLVAKDSAQVRRNEFLTIALQSPVVQQMIGVEGLAELLRATTRTLDLESGDIIPSTSELKLKLAMMAAAAAQQQAAQAQQGTPEKPPQRKELMNGAPATDNFGA